MRKIGLLLILVGSFAHGQIINIPDPAFKTALLTTAQVSDANDNPVNLDPDLDGEIELSDALLVHRLILESTAITDVAGVNQFANISWMSLRDNAITSVDFTGMNNLSSIWIDNNPLTSIAIDGLPNLSYFQAWNTNLVTATITNCNQLSTIWLNDCPNLVSVDASQNAILDVLVLTDSAALENLDASHCPMLEYLDLVGCDALKSLNISGANVSDLGPILIDKHELVHLDVSGCTALTILWIEGTDNALETINLSNCPSLSNVILSATQLTELDLSGAPNITYLIANGLFTHLDLSAMNNPIIALLDNGQLETIDVNRNLIDLSVSGNQITSLDLSAATQLGTLDCENNPLAYLNIKNGANETLLNINNPALQMVCADVGQITAVSNLVPGTVVVSDYCSFIPGGDYNSISGHIRFDDDASGCNTTDIGAQNVRIGLNSGLQTGGSFTNATGQYVFYTGAGPHTIAPQLEHPEYFTLTPASATVDFPAMDNAVHVQDFCLSPAGNHPDMEVVILPLNAARPGFMARYQLVYRNKGTETMNGQLTVSFQGDRLELAAASINPDAQTPDTLMWNYANLQPFEVRTIDFWLEVNAATSEPPVNLGDVLHFTASMNFLSDDPTPHDNQFTLDQSVVNAYDPNDKMCLEGDTVGAELIGQYLHYNINFENIGTADAVNVVVRDVIDTTQFELGSLQVQYASHPMYTRINGNTVEFIFENINLPPSSISPIGGHGNVLFKIKTLPTLQVGDIVTNTANIYFDYNHPVVTNEARTTFSLLNRQVFNADESVSVYPNPTNHLAQITARTAVKTIELFDTQGRILQHTTPMQTTASISLSGRANGVYFVRVTTQTGSKVVKLVKS